MNDKDIMAQTINDRYKELLDQCHELRREVCELHAELSMHDKVMESWEDVAIERGWHYLVDRPECKD